MRYAWDVVIRLRPTIFVAILGYFILAWPSQMLELFLIDIENVESAYAAGGGTWAIAEALRPTLIAMAACVVAVVALWLCSVHLVSLDPQIRERSGAHRIWTLALILLIALSPILGVLGALNSIRLGLDQIAPGDNANLQSAVLNYMKFTGVALLQFAAVIGAATLFRFEKLSGMAHRAFKGSSLIAAGAVTALLLAAIVLWPTVVPWALGTSALVYIFLALLTFVLTAFSTAYQRTGWPITVGVVLAGLLIASVGLSDNHRVEQVKRAAPSKELYESFISWLEQRQDRQFYEERQLPYPVYFVSAEGGGLYAAYHTASILAAIQDQCPNFAQHTFALSSVSGGSLGAAVFAGLAKHGAANTPWAPCTPATPNGKFVKATREYFSTDFLAPLVGATLFPDFLQRFIPAPIYAFDRAKALEQAFETAWEGTASIPGAATANPFRDPVSALWSTDGAAPALFLNVTSVATGARITINPMFWSSTPTAVSLMMPQCDGEETDLKLSSAVSLSARFPWLTPAGWIQRTRPAGAPDKCPPMLGDRVILVDGGYFENSGLELASELVTRLRAVATTRKDLLPHGVNFGLITIFAKDDFAVRWWSEYADLMGRGGGEIATPITVMMNARRARTRAVHSRLLHFDDNNFNLGERFFNAPDVDWTRDPERITWQRKNLHNIVLDGTKFFLPLGWHLSRLARLNIENNGSKDSDAAITNIRSELMGEAAPPQQK